MFGFISQQRIRHLEKENEKKEKKIIELEALAEDNGKILNYMQKQLEKLEFQVGENPLSPEQLLKIIERKSKEYEKIDSITLNPYYEKYFDKYKGFEIGPGYYQFSAYHTVSYEITFKEKGGLRDIKFFKSFSSEHISISGSYSL